MVSTQLNDRTEEMSTLHVEIKDVARGTLTPDQSSSILLIAKAQYKVRRSDSLLPGTVEKLEKRTMMRGGGLEEEEKTLIVHLPSSRWQLRKN
jgi:hypothetical protein